MHEVFAQGLSMQEAHATLPLLFYFTRTMSETRTPQENRPGDFYQGAQRNRKPCLGLSIRSQGREEGGRSEEGTEVDPSRLGQETKGT